VGGLSGRLALLLVVLFLAVKLPLLVYSPYTYDEEEIKPGAIGYVLMHDPPLPVGEYIVGGYEGGSLVDAVASIPFQWVFGPRLLAYKILALCVSLAILLLASALAARWAGRYAAIATGLLIVFSPPYLTQFQFILWGNYVEATGMTLLAMWLFHRFAFLDRRGAHLPPLLGAVCGLGVFMHYGFAVTPVAILLVWYWTDHRLPLRQAFWLFALGFAVGFSPWIAYNATHDFVGLGRIADGVTPTPLATRLARVPGKLLALWTRDTAMAWHFRDVGPVPGRNIGYLFSFIVGLRLVALLVHLRREVALALRAFLPCSRFDLPRTPKAGALVLLTFLSGYWLVFALTDYGLLRAEWGSMDPETHAHLFLTLYPLLLVLGVSVGMTATGRKRPAAWTTALIAVPALVGWIGNLSLLDPSHSNRERLALNYATTVDAVYAEIGATYGEKGCGEWISTRLSGQALRSFTYGWGSGIGITAEGDVSGACARCEPLDTDLRPYCLLGVGAGLYQNFGVAAAPPEAALARLPEPERAIVVAGAAQILLMLGYPDHPYLARTRAFLVSDAARALPEHFVRYLESRLAPLIASEKR
jgi:hypothetical protein